MYDTIIGVSPVRPTLKTAGKTTIRKEEAQVMNHPVRRKDREITDPLEMDEILGRAVFGTLAMGGEEGLYAVPMNFVHKSGKIYVRGGSEG